MKVSFVFSILLVVQCSCEEPNSRLNNAATDSAFNHPRSSSAGLTFDKTRIDFGSVSSDTTLSAKFNFKNTGTDTLVIENIQPDCSCTSFQLSKRLISPGDSASIMLHMSTQHKSGPVQVYSTIDANTKTRLYSLEILADVK